MVVFAVDLRTPEAHYMRGEGAMDMEKRDIHNRVVKNFRTEIHDVPGGRCVLTVSTVAGIVIERIEAPNRAEAEREMAALGYERVPPYVAIEIDQVSRECLRRLKVSREIL